ncbi:hypothetical protein FRC12_015079 [Ceratobasidium sp. 428]|nr:hypothetical protein FRC12_015079 [Ceratobasidium sp. 428]
MMYGAPNRMGLGLRAPMPNYQQPPAQPSPGAGGPMLKATTLFVGSISPGISDSFLTSLFAACGPLRSFKRLQTPAGKPQAFGFAEFEEPDAVSRALQLLDGRLLPSLEGGPPKKLSVKADQKTQGFLKAYEEQRMQSSDDEVAKMTSETLIGSLIAALTDPSALPVDQPGNRGEDIVIPPHLQDLQEQDLPEEQRGLVFSEISLFREKSARRDRPPQVAPPRQPGGGHVWGQPGPDGGSDRERERERERDREREREREKEKEKAGESHGLASKSVGFVKEMNASAASAPPKTDEE